MTIAYTCLLLAGLMPYLWVGFAKFSRRGYNNHAPREFLAKLEGARARAHWAHLNAFEAFPLFATAVIVAQLTTVPIAHINTLAISFVLARSAYGVCYIKDWSTLRSFCWAAGLLSVIALFVLALRQA